MCKQILIRKGFTELNLAKLIIVCLVLETWLLAIIHKLRLLTQSLHGF